MKELDFKNEMEAKLFILKHQMGRRNLTPYQKAKLVLEMEDLIKELKELGLKRKSEGGKKGKPFTTTEEQQKDWSESDQSFIDDTKVVTEDTTPEPTKPVHTWKKLSQIAGVSYDTLMKVKQIEQYADNKLKEKLKTGQMSVNQAYHKNKLQWKSYHTCFSTLLLILSSMKSSIE